MDRTFPWFRWTLAAAIAAVFVLTLWPSTRQPSALPRRPAGAQEEVVTLSLLPRTTAEHAKRRNRPIKRMEARFLDDAPVVADQGIEGTVAALYPSLDGPQRPDFDAQGRLTDEGKARRCGLAVSALAAWERDEAPTDRCGVAHLQVARWMDAAYERGCFDDDAWVAFYRRLHVRRLDRAFGVHPETLGTSLNIQCGRDAWADADLSQRHACEALAHQSGMPLLDGACRDASETAEARDLLAP